MTCPACEQFKREVVKVCDGHMPLNPRDPFFSPQSPLNAAEIKRRIDALPLPECECKHRLLHDQSPLDAEALATATATIADLRVQVVDQQAHIGHLETELHDYRWRDKP